MVRRSKVFLPVQSQRGAPQSCKDIEVSNFDGLQAGWTHLESLSCLPSTDIQLYTRQMVVPCRWTASPAGCRSENIGATQVSLLDFSLRRTANNPSAPPGMGSAPPGMGSAPPGMGYQPQQQSPQQYGQAGAYAGYYQNGQTQQQAAYTEYERQQAWARYYEQR